MRLVSPARGGREEKMHDIGRHEGRESLFKAKQSRGPFLFPIWQTNIGFFGIHKHLPPHPTLERSSGHYASLPSLFKQGKWLFQEGKWGQQMKVEGGKSPFHRLGLPSETANPIFPSRYCFLSHFSVAEANQSRDEDGKECEGFEGRIPSGRGQRMAAFPLIPTLRPYLPAFTTARGPPQTSTHTSPIPFESSSSFFIHFPIRFSRWKSERHHLPRQGGGRERESEACSTSITKARVKITHSKKAVANSPPKTRRNTLRPAGEEEFFFPSVRWHPSPVIVGEDDGQPLIFVPFSAKLLAHHTSSSLLLSLSSPSHATPSAY